MKNKDVQLKHFYWAKCGHSPGVDRFIIYRPFDSSEKVLADAVWVEFADNKWRVSDRHNDYVVQWDMIEFSESLASFPEQELLSKWLNSFRSPPSPSPPPSKMPDVSNGKMYEISSVVQEPGYHRRWFSNGDLHLYAYYVVSKQPRWLSRRASRRIAGFEIDFVYYDFFIRYLDGTLKLYGVDDGRCLSADLLTTTDQKITPTFIKEFQDAASNLDPDLVLYVVDVLSKGMEAAL